MDGWQNERWYHIEKGQRPLNVRERDSPQICTAQLTSDPTKAWWSRQLQYFEDIDTWWDAYSWVVLASVVTIWATATVGKHERRSTYCGETGNRELHMPRVPIALEHLHADQHARHRWDFLVLTLEEETMHTEQCSPLIIHQSLMFNYRKGIYMCYYLLINYTWTCSIIIILYVSQIAQR